MVKVLSTTEERKGSLRQGNVKTGCNIKQD